MWGKEVTAAGCSRPSCVGCGGDPRAVVADVVAAPRRRAVKEEKKPYLGKGWRRGVWVLDALTHQTKSRGWWHTFPRHGLSLCPLSKSWSHVPAQIRRNTVLT